MGTTAWATGTATEISGNGGAGGSINNLAVQGSGYYYWGGSPSFLTLRINNFGFSDLPDAATIDSFEIRHYARDVGSTNVYTDQVYGQKSAGTNLSTNVGGTTAGFRINSTAQWRTISASLFGTTWTTAEAKAAGFGVYFRFGNYDGKYGPNFELDAIQVRVNYTEAAASSGNPNTVGSTRRRR